MAPAQPVSRPVLALIAAAAAAIAAVWLGVGVYIVLDVVETYTHPPEDEFIYFQF